MILITKNVEETKHLGFVLGQALDSKLTICIEGELGAGKTHLVKGIADGLGVLEEVTSPTFAIVQEYNKGDSANQRLDLFHFDLYRISDADELYYIGYDDYLNKYGIMIVEWASNVSSSLPADRVDICIEYTPEPDVRKITISASGAESQRIIDKAAKILPRGYYENPWN